MHSNASVDDCNYNVVMQSSLRGFMQSLDNIVWADTVFQALLGLPRSTFYDQPRPESARTCV